MAESNSFPYPDREGDKPRGSTINLSKDPEELHRPLPFKARLKYFFIRNIVMGIGKLAAVLPEQWTYRSCEGLMMIVYRRAPKFRKLARKHLEIAFGDEKSPEEIDDILHQTYVNYGKNLAEFLMIPHKTPEWIEKKVTFDDHNWNIRTALNNGKGVVGLGGHFGSWELVASRLGLYKYPIVVIVKAQRDSLLSKFVMETRTKWGNEYIFRTRGVKEECLRQLEQNKILGLMADQNVASGGVFVDFFGKKAATATGPAYFNLKTGAPIIPSFPARNPDGTVTLHVLEPLKTRNTGNFEEDIQHNTQLCSNALEEFARKHPAEYFWWHRRWKRRPEQKIDK